MDMHENAEDYLSSDSSFVYDDDDASSFISSVSQHRPSGYKPNSPLSSTNNEALPSVTSLKPPVLSSAKRVQSARRPHSQYSHRSDMDRSLTRTPAPIHTRIQTPAVRPRTAARTHTPAHTPRKYSAPDRYPDSTTPSARSSMHSFRGLDHSTKPTWLFLDTTRLSSLPSNLRKHRPMTTGSVRPRARVFRFERDLSDEDFERVQRLSRPTIASSCRELAGTPRRAPKPMPPAPSAVKQQCLHAQRATLPDLDSHRFTGRKKVAAGEVKRVVDRLYIVDPERIPDCRRITPDYARNAEGLIHSHMWSGVDFSFRIHNGY